MTYYASPACRCDCPGRGFARLEQAVGYARRSATSCRVAFTVWRLQGGRPHFLKRFTPRRVLPCSER